MSGRWRILAAVTLTLATGQASADGLFLNGVSPRSIGRGGTNVAFADNGAALFDNPAAMTNLPGAGLVDVGVDVLITDFGYSNPRNAFASDSSATPLPQISAITKLADGNVAIGFGVFAPAGFSQSYELFGPPLTPGPRTYESFGALVKILPGIAVQVTDRLSIGGTLGVGLSRVELEGPYFLQSVMLPASMKLNADGAALIGSAGLQYKLTDTTTVGATWQSSTRMSLEGNTMVTVAPGVQAEYDTELGIKWPQSVALGVRQVLAQRHVVSADVTWLNWSNTFDNLTVRLASPSSPFFPPGVIEPIPLHWEDTVAVRLGYEYHFDDQEVVRLGYVHHSNPIPNTYQTPFIQAIMEHGISCGYGFAAFGCEFDLSYMFTFGPNQYVGTSGYLGGDFDNSQHSAQTHAICLSVIRRF